MKEIAPFPVIVSEEVMSSDGEIIGYFLTERIPGGLPPEEVIARIKEQGGLVCLPHPFDGFGRFPLKASKREALLSQIDIIEVFNARSLSLKYSEKARVFAQRNGLLASAGSDAHAPERLARPMWKCPRSTGQRNSKSPSARVRYSGKRMASKTTS